jgi:GNAT superfamily N-acetyltransferase
MRTTHRAYDDNLGDFRAVARFFIQHAAHLRTHSTWALSRYVDWRYGLYESRTDRPGFWEQNARLWFDGFGELVGVVISEGGGPEFVICTPPGYRFLYAEMLEWVLANWQARGPRLTVEIAELQRLEAAALAQAGFVQTATFSMQHFDLRRELPARMPLAAGFTLVDMATHPDYRGQRILRDNAFRDGKSRSEDELQRAMAFYNYSHHGPIYHAEVDVCVMAPDGQLVAGCEGLIDAHNAVADIERVCTHSDFRRRGFARAAIQECLVRLQRMGLTDAYITGYSEAAIALYTSLGAEEPSRACIYTQDVAGSAL